jgi:hypothetical protein
MKNFFLLLVIGLLLSACDKDGKDLEQGQGNGQEPEKPEISKLGCVTGKITIFNTGSVTDAYVRLSLSEKGEAIYSKLIATNGDYTIDNVEEGTYYFKVFKQGTVDILFHETIRVQPKELNDGKCRQMDWAISKLPPNLYIVEVGTENKIDTIDFGMSENRLYFQIYNNSENTYTWCTDFDEVKLDKKWLGAMNPTTGTLYPNDKPEIITITIDRTKLVSGKNTAKFLINSDKDGGGVLTIIAEVP